ncbi:MAG: DegT/DnrJ/EryC1/StrS family aminotransferase [Saprospiraceae bacterium]|nr:DegT/DnrJ/EryC1/StrS family aminotransferase [Candidatus Vicinibacter affinis]
MKKGTNKIEFKRGGVQSYEWNCLGSSFAASQLQAAVLLAQLEEVDMIFEIRKSKWQIYDRELKIENSSFRLPQSFDFSSYNTSVFYLEILKPSLRNILIRKFNEKGIQASFHYKCLHTSPFGKQWNKEELPNAKYWEENIIRLPLHTDLSDLEVVKIIGILNEFLSESE